MKDLSDVDMSDLAKEWETRINTRVMAQLSNYSLLYGSTSESQEDGAGVKPAKVELIPRPQWNAP